MPSKLRPKIVPTGTIIGKVSCERIALPLGAKVFASLGDLQSTVYPLLSDSSAGIFNHFIVIIYERL